MKRSNETRACWAMMLVVGLITTTGTRVKADVTFGEPVPWGPPVNHYTTEASASMSADGLEFYFDSWQGGAGILDIWVTKRASTEDEWGPAEALGPAVNSDGFDWTPRISADGLELYFTSDRLGGKGGFDIYVTRRESLNSVWGPAENVGAWINTTAHEGEPCVSADGLELYYSTYGQLYVSRREDKHSEWLAPQSLGPMVNGIEESSKLPSISPNGLYLFFSNANIVPRAGGLGYADIWMTYRPSVNDDWREPVNLGAPVNSQYDDGAAWVTHDGSMLIFSTGRPGGMGSRDIWQVPISPIVDFNGNRAVDKLDLNALLEHWGSTDSSLYDIAPIPFGDGVVDANDLRVLNEHLDRRQLTANPYPVNLVDNLPHDPMLSWEAHAYAQMHDVYFGADYNDVRNATRADATFMGRQEARYYDPGALAFDTTYYWRVDEVYDVAPDVPCTGPVWQFTTGGVIAGHDPADGSTGVTWPTDLTWIPSGPGLQYDVYLSDDVNDVAQATPDDTDIYRGQLTADQTSFATGNLLPTTTYFWRIDAVDSTNPEDLWPGKVRQLTTINAVTRHYPGSNASQVSRSVVLNWEPNGPGLHYDVYFGDDESGVAEATRDSLGIYQGQQTSDQTTFTPGKLRSSTTYFWRIDGVDSANPQNAWKGKVWKFTTIASR